MKTVKCFRFVTRHLKSQNGDIQWTPGEWVKHTGPLSLCNSGLHACRDPRASLEYVYGERWFTAEARGEVSEEGDKLCAGEMRILREIPLSVIQRFAIDCAERSLIYFEEKYPEDKRPREAVEAARRCLEDPTNENREAESAAWSAARSAESAAWSAAWSAESAAWSAAWSAARSAARSAESAAWSAARSAESAAWSAARSAEQKWQSTHLKQLIKQALKEAYQ